jgi:hypothetical protein
MDAKNINWYVWKRIGITSCARRTTLYYNGVEYSEESLFGHQRVRMPLSKQKLNHSLYYWKAIEKYGEKGKKES